MSDVRAPGGRGRRLVPLAASALALALPTAAWASPGGDLSAEPDTHTIVGGELAETCDWPTTVLMQGGGGLCTGTLVHPEIVLFAAHCPTPSQVRFGESTNRVAAAVPVERCERFGSGAQVANDDYAYCKLAQAVELAPTPILYGCERDELQIGSEVAIAGFGQDESGRAGTKRWATTQVTGFPSSGNNANMVAVGGNGTGAWQGDSGGPAYLQLDDGGWRAFGIVSGGSGAGQPVLYVQMHTVVEWVESRSGVDITPCHDVDGTWNPGPDCGRYATTPTAGGSWANGCANGDPLSPMSQTCGLAFGETDTVPPTIAITSPTNGATFPDDPTTVQVTIDAQDDVGIVRVWLEINGADQPIEDRVAPYEFSNVTFPAGSYTLRAKVEDFGGQIAVSEPVGVGVGGAAPPDTGGGGTTTGGDPTGGDPTGGGTTSGGGTTDASSGTSGAEPGSTTGADPGGSTTSAGTGTGEPAPGGGEGTDGLPGLDDTDEVISCSCTSDAPGPRGAAGSLFALVALGLWSRRRRRA
jgi:MYXO-CTERM domain-containing protein